MKYKYLFGAFFILAAEVILLKYGAPAWLDLVFGVCVFMIWILYKIFVLWVGYNTRVIDAFSRANDNQTATSMAILQVAAIQTTEAGLVRALKNGGQWVEVGGQWQLQLASGRTGPVEIIEQE